MLTLPDLLRSTVQAHGRRPAIVGDGSGLNWAQYADSVARTAHMLQALGLRAGDRFATLCRNSVRHAQLLQGGYWAGIVPIPMNFRLTGADIAWMLDNAACRALFVDADLLYLLDQAHLAPWHGRAVCVGAAPDACGLPATDALLDGAPPAAPHPSAEDDLALCLYTGGTTGRGKGVRLSHRNIVANALQLARVMAPCADDIYLHVSPMFHSTDLKATVVSMFGGGHVYMKEASPEEVLETIERHRVTIASLLPSLIARILAETRVERYDLRSLRLISYGTSPLDEDCLRAAMKAFSHVGFHQCYGLTETSPFIAILDETAHRLAATDRPELFKAAGRVLPGTRLALLDDEGREVPPGATGEIVVSGPQVGLGYLGLPGEDARAFRDGVFHTGDAGRLDEDGYLYILDRKQEVIAARGACVYTRAVEDVLHHCPGVAEAAVIGVPDADDGEALLAVVVADGAVPPAPGAIVGFCESHLAPGLVPRQFMFVDGLPRTPMGKVKKQELQEAYRSLMQAGGAAAPAVRPRTRAKSL
ncbi:Long-chain-fatty-acid--CoA ligase [Pigmentiphaga humi]|uniref:Long-chain-fatty-acid--CoA ligase n=1 Tax=Pigmentiphaga humi TaxID=2478468 RepID=A0A3P4B034_9BURK|nr:AMP-binding protein [Pigmentiphaga humi]VCU68926.1 Long-chain-fatty-acid--CoA ligase [Pigmentiphaga humi]